jgi:hypothetical protein
MITIVTISGCLSYRADDVDCCLQPICEVAGINFFSKGFGRPPVSSEIAELFPVPAEARWRRPARPRCLQKGLQYPGREILATPAHLVTSPDGYIAQWFRRPTSDQQVPGSNPGLPFVNAGLPV